MENHLQHLRGLIEQHVAETGSVWGEQILNDFRTYIGKFWVVKPKAASIDSLIENLRAQPAMMSTHGRQESAVPGLPRADPAKVPVELRVQSVHARSTRSSMRTAPRQQAGRCLACGNPFCEWKCPVHNYIPNWLKLIAGRQPVRGGGAVAQDQLAAGDVRPHLPAGPPVRRRVHAERRARRRDASAPSRSTSPTKRSSRAGGRTCRTCVKTGKRVAVIGAGPAGLGCADILVRNGVDARGVRPLSRHRRPAHLRHSAVQAGEGGRREAPRGASKAWASSSVLGVEVGRDICRSSSCSRIRRRVPRHGHLRRT